MNFGTNGIDTTKTEDSYAPMPSGWYQAQITSEKEQPTAKGGTLLIYEFTILGRYEGVQYSANYANRKVWGSYNVVCPGSEKAEQIAMTEIAKMGKAAGLTNIRTSSELVGKLMDIRLDIRQDEGYEPKNEIKGYRSCTNAVAVPPSTPAQAAAPTPAAGVTPPWGGK